MGKRSPTPAKPFPSILARILGNGSGTMSQVAARQILKFGFNQADQERMADLMERNNKGKLSPDEKAELSEFAEAGTVVAIMQSQARKALNRARKKA
jgi:hypothetical protein